MINQMKYILWKLLFVSLSIVIYSTFNVLTQADDLERTACDLVKNYGSYLSVKRIDGDVSEAAFRIEQTNN